MVRYKLLFITLFFAFLTGIDPTNAQDGQYLPSDLLNITPENAAQLQLLNVIGPGSVNDMELSPDGKQLVIGSTVGLFVHDPADFNAPPHLLSSHYSPRVAYNKSGTRLAAVMSENYPYRYEAPASFSLLVWDTQSWDSPTTIAHFDKSVDSVAFSPDEKTILIGFGRRDGIKILDSTTGTVFASFDGWNPVYSATGDFMIFQRQTKTVELVVWDTRSQQEFVIQNGYKVILHPTRNLMAYVNLNNSDVQLYDLDLGRSIRVTDGTTFAPLSLAFDALGELLAVTTLGDNGNEVHMWSIRQQKEVQVLSDRISRCCDSFDDFNFLAFTPDGQYVMASAISEMGATVVWVWKRDGEQIAALEGAGSALLDSANNQFIYDTGSGTVRTWNIDTQEEKAVLAYPYQWWRHAAMSVDYSPNGQLFAIGHRDSAVYLWDVHTGRRLATLAGHESSVGQVRFSPDGQWLASITEPMGGSPIDYTVRLWNTTTFEQAALIQQTQPIYHIAFSPDGRLLATAVKSDDEDLPVQVYLWRVDDLLKRGQLEEGMQAAVLSTDYSGGDTLSVEFVPNSDLLAVTGSEIQLWDVATLLDNVSTRADSVSPEASIPESSGPFAVNRDGTLLAYTDLTQHQVYLWDVQNRREKTTLSGHNGPLHSLAFNPAGTLLASSSADSEDVDNSIRIWDVKTGKQVGFLDGLEEIWSVAFNPEGTLLASGSGGCYRCPGEGSSSDDAVRIWGIPG